ncbi:MAG: sulfur oxidation c-type cytochrome SoxA [Rhodospirillaceae bacterium]|nr:sulfur oxidation c-type cytochrome SoxA [Rhodospirillaceae bacterium]MBT6085074.1 sulfur oxidation c-type cytochrome SoxA [Rhodospirillaceae bacterium]MBT6883029.1 sulfur oxidation c-type cytochrome SoxA [Rhodospirillaceae bacterium]MBT7250015.1 sulfur oxidation c-type cytochrome SoxA [Rhodospirillaceae bacterium]
MGKFHLGSLLAAGAILAVGFSTQANAEGKHGMYANGEIRSGYTYLTPQSKAIQNDDFQNPGMIWVDDGATLYEAVDGKAGKSCKACHGKAEVAMKGVATTYPKYDEDTKKIKNIEAQVNRCRTKHMQAKPWKYESGQLLAMTVFIRHQSRGMPMNVSVDGPAVPFFQKGEKFYKQRRGALDMACSNCHVDNAGKNARANLLSQGQTNGFPTYRLKWQKVGSTHRRFRGCNKQVRATPYKYASDEYMNLELYVAWRGRGLPVETPAVRN